MKKKIEQNTKLAFKVAWPGHDQTDQSVIFMIGKKCTYAYRLRTV